MSDDDRLYEEFLHGKTESYDELMIRYGDKLTLYLKGYLASYEDAEDVMIEAFSRIMIKKPKIEKGNFKVYLFRTAHNLVANFYRHFDKIDIVDIEDLENEIRGEESPENGYMSEEKKRILHLCLERLDAQTREAFFLVYFEDMSYEQAAGVMKVNVKKINNLLTRGKERLRKELAKEGIEDNFL